MNRLTPSSRPTLLVCPLCEKGRLQDSDQDAMSCDLCSGLLSGATLRTLRQITALPDVLGKHTCECGHPEMRHLPDGTYHCPACGSEVLSFEASRESGPEHRSNAYWSGWLDGRFRVMSSFVDNPNLARWADPLKRLDYYQGHRTGGEARRREELEGGETIVTR